MKRFLSLFICISVIFAAFCGCNLPSVNLTSTSTPSEDLLKFFDYLKAGDYVSAEGYVYNFSTLGFKPDGQSELQKRLESLLTASRNVSVISEGEIFGRDCTVTVELTTLDFGKLDKALSERVLDEIKTREFNGETFETNEAILAVVYSVLDSMTVSMTEYYSSNRYDVDMKFSDDCWKIVCSEELYSAIIGYAI